MGYANRIARVKPLLNFKQCKKRLTWATEKRYWTVEQWSRVIFSDESEFCISLGNRGLRVWRKSYEAAKLTSPAARNPALNFHKAPWSGDIMKRNVSSWSWNSVRLSLRTNVTAVVYQEVLEHFLLLMAEQLFGGDEFTIPTRLGSWP